MKIPRSDAGAGTPVVLKKDPRLCGADGYSTELEEKAAENVKRIVRGRPDAQSPWEIASFLELKTVWHPIGQ